MFKKLCVLCVGVALCFGTLGCGGGAVEKPKDTKEPPKTQPTENADQSMTAPE